MRVEQLMTRDVRYCRAADPMSRAAQIMWDRDCGVVPVVDEAGRAIGVITDRDVCMAVYTRGQCADALRVSDAMSREVYACHPEDSVSDAQKLFRTRLVRRVPVVDAAGKLVGILSLSDVLREIARDRGRVGIDEVLTTAAAVCKPRTATNDKAAANGGRRNPVPVVRNAELLSGAAGGR